MCTAFVSRINTPHCWIRLHHGTALFRHNGNFAPRRFLRLKTVNEASSTIGRAVAFTLGCVIVVYPTAVILKYECQRSQMTPQHWQRPLAVLIGMNLFVFSLHRLHLSRWSSHRSLTLFLQRFFFNSHQQRYFSSMIGACFSHQNPLHLLLNMFMLTSFFPVLCLRKEWSWPHVTAVYLLAGLAGSLFSRIFFGLVNSTAKASLGASGAACGLAAASAIDQPDSLFGIIGVTHLFPQLHFRGVVIVAAFATMEVAMLLLRPRWLFWDGASHLGGIAMGVLYASFHQSWHFGSKVESALESVWCRVRQQRRD